MATKESSKKNNQLVAVSFEKLSEWGLVAEINSKVLHPRGLALFYETDTFASPGAYIAEDLVWDFSPEFLAEHTAKLEKFDADRVKILTELLAASVPEPEDKVQPATGKEHLPLSIRYMTSGGMSAFIHDYVTLPSVDMAQVQRYVGALMTTENADIVGILVSAHKDGSEHLVGALFRHCGDKTPDTFEDPLTGEDIQIADAVAYWEANYARPQRSADEELADQLKTLLERVKSLEEDNAKLRLWNGPVTCAAAGTGEKPPAQDLGKSFAGAAS